MNPRLVVLEINLIKNYFKDKCSKLIDFCELELDNLEEDWPDPKLIDILVCSFTPLMRELQSEHMPGLTFDFIQTYDYLNDRVTVVTTNGIRFLMKREEYTKDSDLIVHEYFVGLHLNQLKSEIPTFASVIGAYSCTPTLPGAGGNEWDQPPCRYTGHSNENVNFILYEYVKGDTLYKVIKSRRISLSETWVIINIVYESILYAHRKFGFIHQDLHFHNIILKKLSTPSEIVIGDRTFVSKYLPVIIDYGRSSLFIDNQEFSPVAADLGIPATSTYYDLAYLLYLFSLFSRENIFGIPNLGEIKTLKEKEIADVYVYFDDKYSTEEKSQSKLQISSSTIIKKFGKCPPQPYVPKELAKEYQEETSKITLVRQQIKLIDKLYSNPNAYDLDRYFSLMLDKKYSLLYKDEVSTILKTFLGVILDPYSSPQIKRKFVEYMNLIENDPKYLGN